MDEIAVNDLGENEEFETVFSSYGYEYFEGSDKWALSRDVVANVSLVTDLLPPQHVYSFKKALSFIAQTHSSGHVQSILSSCRSYFKVTGVYSFNEMGMINFKSALSRKDIHILGRLRGFLKYWYELGYIGVDEQLIEMLYSWRIPGSIKGDVVKRFDPYDGPLTDIELLALNDSLAIVYERSDIDIFSYALVKIHLATGRRPKQIAELKLMDIQNEGSKNFLNIPRAKQRSGGFRTSFKRFAITPELMEILLIQKEDVIAKAEMIFGFQLSHILKNKLPLFPKFQIFEGVRLNPSELSSWLDTDRVHLKTKDIDQIFRSVSKVVNVFSERTLSSLKVMPYRLRYTIGTRAAREGFGTFVIAELLDHKDTQNAHVYVENIPEYARRINEKVGHLMAPYAKAFSGVLVDEESDAVRGNDKSSRIKLNPEDNIGTCGSYDYCGANVPIPCYTCSHFQPWLDVPHQEVLDRLIEERERIVELTEDLAVASANDRIIFAVSEVIQRCEKRKQELARD